METEIAEAAGGLLSLLLGWEIFILTTGLWQNDKNVKEV